ncbi:MAG TPA: endo alpha-1,4 polygalactosaminidase [Candidatus Hydrogenedentes bacterium]|nr:endo alpha-1,4 polygalactosaminidase [Candidatus Hydrogenedentota bacterium]
MSSRARQLGVGIGLLLLAGCGGEGADGPSRWQPRLDATWRYQLSEPVTAPVSGVDVYVLDLFDTPGETVSALKAGGARVVAYFSAGSYEDWRPDASRYPGNIVGAPYEGWPGERWVDIRALDVLGPILRDRLDLAVQKGFDGVDPDNVDGYLNATGFPLRDADQIHFNRWIAREAHRRGLAVGRKNDPEQATVLEPDFDFAVIESCYAEGWCDLWKPFVDAAKPVLAIEYTDTLSESEFVNGACASVLAGVRPVLCRRELDGWTMSCPGN